MEYAIYRSFFGGFYSFYSNINLDRTKYSEQYLQILSEHSYDEQARKRRKEEFLGLTGKALPYMENAGQVSYIHGGDQDVRRLEFWICREHGVCFKTIRPEKREGYYAVYTDRGEPIESFDFPKRMVHTGVFFPLEQAWELISRFIECGEVPGNIVLKNIEDFPVVSEEFAYGGTHGRPLLQGFCAKYYGSPVWKRLEKFGKKLKAYAYAPVTPREYQRMEPFAEDDELVAAVLEVLDDYNIPPYISEREWQLLFTDFHIPGFWYCISLISCARRNRESSLACLRKLAVGLKGNAVENEDEVFMLLRNIAAWKEKYPDLEEIEEMLKTG